MPGSPAFARIRRDVLRIVAAIPAGRVSSFRAIGAHLDVMPRHVAYILAQLSDDEQQLIPWHRVVSDGGAIARVKRDARGRAQADLLTAEGVALDGSGAVADFGERFFAITEEATGVPAGARPR